MIQLEIGQVLIMVMILQPQMALKVWQPSTSLQDPSNWGPQGPPSDCDRLLLSQAEDITVQVPSTPGFSVKSIVLPRQGILTFPLKSVLTLSDSEKCAGKARKDVWFLSGVKGWLDPQNWNSSSEGGWTPHRNRVPCNGEEVIFPEGRSLAVMLPAVLVPYGPISLKGKKMNPSEWSSFLQSEEGYESFQGSAEMRGLDWRFDDGDQPNSLHFCGMNAYAIRDWSYETVDPKVFDEAICLFAKPRCKTTEEPQCYSPVHPEGHCCGVCGTIVNVRLGTENSQSWLGPIKNIVVSVLRDFGFLSLLYYVGPRSNGDVQIVLVSQDGDPTDSFTAARDIAAKLREEKFKTVGDISYSGFSKHSGGGTSATFAIIFGTLIAIGSFFASIYYVYMILPNQKWGRLTRRDPFTFARFRNNLQEATSNETLMLDTDRPTTDAFANPLYNPDGAVTGPAIETNSPHSDGQITPLPRITSIADTPQLVLLDEPTPGLMAEDTPTPPLPVEKDTTLEEESDEDDFAQLQARAILTNSRN